MEFPSIESRVAELDTTLFDDIPSQTSADDRRSLLAIHAAVAARRSPFSYLEIGSHLGGSIQPYLRDRRCARIISIDKRPLNVADERLGNDAVHNHGPKYEYPENSTQRMLENLTRVSSEGVRKVVTFETDAGDLNPALLPCQAEICFIDGEHTNGAAERDFAFCCSVVADPGVICFHDSEIVFQAISNIVERLKSDRRPFRAYNLPSSVFVIDLGLDLHAEPSICDLLTANYIGYFSALNSMAPYRDFFNSWFARKLRDLYAFPPIGASARLVRSLASTRRR
jgi:hypothetical protein